MGMELIRGLYDYHRWANRRLFEVATDLGDAVTRDMGKHWSVPTVKGMFAHIYGSDSIWLRRWKGGAPAPSASAPRQASGRKAMMSAASDGRRRR